MGSSSTATTGKPKLHSLRRLRRRYFNRALAAIYSLALLALFYHHTLTLHHSESFASISTSISLLIADLILAFMWSTSQTFRMNMIVREVHVENLEKIVSRESFPALDIFICTADPYKEPPLSVVNTALSVMAYDYPTDKMSVYVSDDGGSELTLFAFMEAAKFGKYWLPFVKQNNITNRCPDAFFRSNYSATSHTLNIKDKYESMKRKIESVRECEALGKWKQGTYTLTPQHHPAVIQVLLESCKDKDVAGDHMPNLVYVSREKSKATPHHFKAGALNALLRVSAVMSNAPVVLTLDCDMASNDPKTAREVLCFLMDPPPGQPGLGYIQFPQVYEGLNKADIYASEFKLPFQVNPFGMDGIRGPNYVGTGCFFTRRVFFGGPSSFVQPEIPELRPDFVVKQSIKSQHVINLAHQVAGCNYERQTNWGSKIGFKYGTLVEDFYTGYRLQCEGWHSIFYHPNRPAFLGDVPISLCDVLSQNKRWFFGFLEVVFSKFSPITYGVQAMGILAAYTYAHYALWSIWSIPIAIYALIPQLTLLNNFCIFPKVSDPWFFLYAFLFHGAYGQSCVEFLLAKSTLERWWSDQRFWLIRGLTAHAFANIEYMMKPLGIPMQGFNVTSKVVDNEQRKRYDQGIFEFGVPSPMFVPLSMAAIINLIAFLYGFLEVVFRGGSLDSIFVQMFIAGFGLLNSLPIYEAMVLRNDKGRMPAKITIISSLLAGGLYITSLIILKL